MFRFSCWDILVSPNISPLLKLEAFCHITGPFQLTTALVALTLYPFLAWHGIDGPLIRIVSAAPCIEPTLSAVIACYAKTPGSSGHYRSFLSRTARLRFIFPHFGLKCGTTLFETRAIIEGLFSNDATFLTTPKEGSARATGGGAKLSSKSTNTAKKSSSDDAIAWAGFMLGFHRLIYVLMFELFLPYTNIYHAIIRILNVWLFFSFFWVNGSFLLEKHKVFSKLCRASMRAGVFYFILVVAAYRYALSHSFVETFQLNRVSSLVVLNACQPPFPNVSYSHFLSRKSLSIRLG